MPEYCKDLCVMTAMHSLSICFAIRILYYLINKLSTKFVDIVFRFSHSPFALFIHQSFHTSLCVFLHPLLPDLMLLIFNIVLLFLVPMLQWVRNYQTTVFACNTHMSPNLVPHHSVYNIILRIPLLTTSLHETHHSEYLIAPRSHSPILLLQYPIVWTSTRFYPVTFLFIPTQTSQSYYTPPHPIAHCPLPSHTSPFPSSSSPSTSPGTRASVGGSAMAPLRYEANTECRLSYKTC